MAVLALSELLGAPVSDASGAVRGKVREVALMPQDDPAHVAALIVRTREGDRMVKPQQLRPFSAENLLLRSSLESDKWAPLTSSEGMLLLERDLLDQQIIDVHGRKVVRVNDVDFHIEDGDHAPSLKISEVEIGTRGAVRQLLKGLVPRAAARALSDKVPARVIPWEFVDLIETDPARRVKLKIEHERLSKLHPADIADILEELAPAQREAVFETLDEEVAADALEEIEPEMQRSLLASIDSEKAADIVEEMDPDAAADVLGELSRERSEEILDEMQPEEREEVEELLEFEENTAAGRMTTEYLALEPTATVQDAIELLRRYEGDVETISNIFLVTADQTLAGVVALPKLALSGTDTQLGSLRSDPLIHVSGDAKDYEVAELFDKYNLLSVSVLDENGKMAGIITADDVISMLRK
jgi:magnesium transporter